MSDMDVRAEAVADADGAADAAVPPGAESAAESEAPPAVGWLFIAVTLLIAAVQAMMGTWLGRSLAGPIRRRRGKREAAAVVG